MPTAASDASDASVPTSLDVSSSFTPGSDALSQSEGLPEGLVQSSHDPDSFSDSYSHITPSPGEPPASLLSTETLGGMEYTQEEERLTHPLNEEEVQQEGEESDLSPRTTDLGKQAGMNSNTGLCIKLQKAQPRFLLCWLCYDHMMCLYPPLSFFLHVLFVFEVYLVDQLIMDLFSIWARKLSGEAVVGMRKGA